MRNPDRLFNFYSQLSLMHREVPDLRFGQLMYSFLRWHEDIYGIDVFYLEEDEFLEHYKKFLNDIQAKYVGVNI